LAYYILKISLSAALIVLISELAKRSSFVGALIASISFVSLLAMTWLYIDTRDTVQVIKLSYSIFWLVIPSLIFFIALPALLKNEINFYISLGLSISITVGAYFIMILILKRFNIIL